MAASRSARPRRPLPAPGPRRPRRRRRPRPSTRRRPTRSGRGRGWRRRTSRRWRAPPTRGNRPSLRRPVRSAGRADLDGDVHRRPVGERLDRGPETRLGQDLRMDPARQFAQLRERRPGLLGCLLEAAPDGRVGIVAELQPARAGARVSATRAAAGRRRGGPARRASAPRRPPPRSAPATRAPRRAGPRPRPGGARSRPPAAWRLPPTRRAPGSSWSTASWRIAAIGSPSRSSKVTARPESAAGRPAGAPSAVEVVAGLGRPVPDRPGPGRRARSPARRAAAPARASRRARRRGRRPPSGPSASAADR